MGNKLKSKWILCFIIFSAVLLIYGNHLFKERTKKFEDMRKKESLEFMEDGWKKYIMMLYDGSWYRVKIKFTDVIEQNVYVKNAFQVWSVSARDNTEIN